MEPTLHFAEQCALTGVTYRASSPREGEGRGLVALLNGIGLDHEGFQDALTALASPACTDRRPFVDWVHLALTVPGFEDSLQRLGEPVLDLSVQAERVADFLVEQLRQRSLDRLVLYGFSYGSDLAVDVLEDLLGRAPVARVVLAELNVRMESCFITRRMAESYEEALNLGRGRHQQAYAGFVSRILRAYTSGQIDHALMQDLTLYFRVIARKDWHQLAHSAGEVSRDPAVRVRRLRTLLDAYPGMPCDLVFSDPKDVQAAQELLQEGGSLRPGLRIWNASAHGHFWHMTRPGVLENLSRG